MATYICGLYCRLSREDVKNGKRDVSMSIENQQAILEKYVRDKNLTENWNVFKIYVDDDFSGTTFNRPGFMEMMNHVREGLINCVVVKDLSRFGREYIQAAIHRRFLADNGVRLIAINDAYDSENSVNRFDLVTPIKELINEMYAADVSYKQRSVKKLMGDQGKFANSRAPYGYQKSKEDKHVLVVDDAVSHNVERIFDLYLSGMTGRAIAELFNNEGILSPNEYYYKSTGKPNPYLANSKTWGSEGIMGIIRNPAYYGAISSGKREVENYSNKRVRAKPKSEWTVIEGMHEPIVSKEKWDEAQRVKVFNKKNVKSSAKGEVKLFTGLAKCADCGGNMVPQWKSGRESYRCSSYIQKGKSFCPMHKIDHNVLYEAVLADLRRYAVLAAEDETKLIDKILRANSEFKVKNLARYEKGIRDAKNRIGKIDGLMQAAFEEKLEGNITAEALKRMMNKYEDEQRQLQADLIQMERECVECRQVEHDLTGWISRIKECLSIDGLTRAMAVELIDRIEVSQMREEGGEKVIDIEIYYKFGLKNVGQVNPLDENRAS